MQNHFIDRAGYSCIVRKGEATFVYYSNNQHVFFPPQGRFERGNCLLVPLLQILMVYKSRFWKNKEGEKERVSKREINNKNALRKQHTLDFLKKKRSPWWTIVLLGILAHSELKPLCSRCFYICFKTNWDNCNKIRVELLHSMQALNMLLYACMVQHKQLIFNV